MDGQPDLVKGEGEPVLVRVEGLVELDLHQLRKHTHTHTHIHAHIHMRAQTHIISFAYTHARMQ